MKILKSLSMLIILLMAGCQNDPFYQSLFAKEETVRAAKDKMVALMKSYSGVYPSPVNLCRLNGIGYSAMGGEPYFSAVYPIRDCVDYAQSLIDQAKRIDIAQQQQAEADAIAKKEADREAEKAKEAAEKAAQQAEEQRQNELLVADLKAGKKPPKTLEQAMIVFDASVGDALPGSPKIKPDGELYGTQGKIVIADHDDTFIAEWVSGNMQYAAMSALGIYGRFSPAPRYFRVKIPNALKETYYKSGKVGGVFVFVGRYVANSHVTTTLGGMKPVPVFDAVYWQSIF